MDAGVAAGADGGEPAPVMNAGPAVMHVRPDRTNAARDTAAAVAGQHRLATAAETPARIGRTLITATAAAGNRRHGSAARAEKSSLD